MITTKVVSNKTKKEEEESKRKFAGEMDDDIQQDGAKTNGISINIPKVLRWR